MGERVLVLGATGFIGAEVARQLRENSRLRDVVHHGHSLDGRLRPIDADWELLDLQLAGVDDIVRLLRRSRADVVVNCVGATSGSAAELRSANTGVVDKLLAALCVRDARLVHLGSAAEYGSQQVGVPVNEEMAPRPFSDYGRAKLRAPSGSSSPRGPRPSTPRCCVCSTPSAPARPGPRLPGARLAPWRSPSSGARTRWRSARLTRSATSSTCATWRARSRPRAPSPPPLRGC